MIARLIVLVLILGGSVAGALTPWRAPPVWNRATSAHFIVYSAGPVPDLMHFTQRLERFDAVMRNRLRIPDEDDGVKPLVVFMVKTQGAVSDATGVTAGGILGFYSPSAHGTIAVVPRKGDETGSMFDLAAEPILFHEYTHHLMLQYFPATYSRWYTEGFAELYSTLEFDEGEMVTIGKPNLARMPMLRVWTATSLERLVTAKPEDVDDMMFATLYSKGWLLMHYLSFNQTYAKRMPAYVAALNAGKSDKAAMEGAFGTTVSTLDREMKAYFERGTMPILSIRIPARPAAPPRVEAVPPAMNAAMNDYILFMNGPPAAQVKPLAGRTRKLAETFPADLFAQRMLAEVELLAGRPAEAERAADAALAIDPRDGRAQLAKGQAQLSILKMRNVNDPAQWTAARQWVVRANRTDPDDPLPLMSYYRSFKLAEQLPSAAASKGLARATELAPQDDGVRLMLGEDQARLGDYAAAIATVRPVATRPHRTSDTKRAAALLAAWQALVPVGAGAKGS